MLKALGLLLKWLFLKKPDQAKRPTLKERAHQTVRAHQESEIHRGPKGGLYRIDAKGEKGLSQGFRAAQARQVTSGETASYQNCLSLVVERKSLPLAREAFCCAGLSDTVNLTPLVY